MRDCLNCGAALQGPFCGQCGVKSLGDLGCLAAAVMATYAWTVLT